MNNYIVDRMQELEERQDVLIKDSKNLRSKHPQLKIISETNEVKVIMKKM